MGSHGQFTQRVRRFSIALLAGVLVATAPAMAQAAEASDPEPVLGGQLWSTGTAVTVEVLPASAGYTSTLFLLDPEEVQVATNRDVGTQVTVGPYGSGTELVFGIRVAGQEFRLGPGGRNPDGIPHAVVDFGPDGCAVVGFEDLFGGGDRDYDDNKFRFCGGIAPEVPEEPEEPPTPDPIGPPVADAGDDQTVDEGSTVTLDGSGSRASTRPALQASEQQGTLPGGTSLGATLDGLDEDAPGIRVAGSVSVGQGPAAQNTSIAYVVDVSGSAGDPGGPCGDVNADRRSNTVLDCELAAALKLHEEVEAAGTVDKVAVITFSSGASAVDLDPTSATATLVSPTADKDGNGVTDVVQAIKRIGGSGGTNFLPPVRTACQLLATTGSPNLVTAFMSDGAGTGSLKTVLPCDPPVTFHAFAVGSGSRCNSGSAVGSRLIDMATLSGGTCTDVPTPSELPDILPQVVGSKLTSVSYSVDGGEPVDLGSTLELPLDGPADVDVAFDLPSGLAAGSHRICLTVTGEDSGGTSSETTCSDLVTVTGEVSYSWRSASRQGPPVFLSSRTAANPTFVAPDDGRYVFELTVTDGTGGSATDEVVVEVSNLAPAMDLTHGDSFAGGVTQVNATLTDEGWLDSHSAVVDWGDGTTSPVDVTTAGAGWGTFFGSHVYRRAGSFDVVVTLTDDDGGSVVRRVDHLEVAEAAAVWANATGSRALDWAGGSGEIQGRVHTNGELRFVGAAKTVRGTTTYAGSIAADTTRNSFTPLPAQSGVQDFPMHPEVAAFRPGGPVATEVGTAYHDMSSQCSGGSWHDVQSALPSGVYYASCDIQLNGSQIGGRVTLVSEGHVKIAGSRPTFEPYRDGLLVLAGATGSKAIDISASSSKFLGVLFAGSGQISVSGGGNRFHCGILGDTVSITGTDVTVRGADCGRPGRTVSGPVVVPDLAADLTVDRERALPGDTLGYDVTVTNRGTTLVVPSLIGLENVDSATARVAGHDFTVERQVAGTGEWVPVATLGDPSMTVHVRPNPFDGVQYADGGAVVGTTVAPGGWATWGVQAELSLTPAQVTELLDEELTSGVRTRVDFTLDPSAVQARRLYTYGTDFAAELRALGADATGVAVTAILPDGDATVITAAESDPDFRIAPGASVTRHREWTVPVPVARATTETDAGYLSRLVALDDTQLNGAAYASASGGVGRLVAPLLRVSTTRELPVVGVSTVGDAAVPAGTSADYDLRLANLGSADASALEVEATADTAPLTVAGAPSGLGAGELATARTSYAAPAASSGSVVLRGTAAWQDARGNTYGLSGSDLAVERQLPATLSASLVDTLVGDVGDDGAVSPGDTVRYTLTVANRGGLALAGVTGRVPVPADATLVPGSGATPDGGTVSLAGGEATFTLPDIAGSASRRVVFDVVVAQPFPAGVARIEAQGTVSATGLDSVQTDDPALPGAADPTRTTVTRPTPALTASLTGRLVVDADGSGNVSPGDTLAYDLTVSSVGTQQVTGIDVDVPAPAGTSVVPDSVRTTQGSVTSGPGVSVDLGTLAPFQQATIDFRLRLASPLPAGTTAIRTVGTVTSNELDPIKTDDPQTVDVGDGTDIPIGDPGTDPEVPGPTLSGLSPVDGARVAVPTDVGATVTAPPGSVVTTWQVVLTPAGGGQPTVLGSGTGGGSTATVAAVIDPTLLDNGLYTVSIVSTSSDGGRSTSSTTVMVDGGFKPGRMTTSFADHEVGVGGLPLQVVRSYDSYDGTAGDFGTGWTVDIADFEVATGRPLGQSGWKGASDGCGLIFCTLKYTSSLPHFVSVTWPDGKQEAFDLVGVNGSTFFPGIAEARFVPRAGTGSTSSLQVVGDNSLWFPGDGNAYAGAFGTDGIFDPRTFRLVDRNGTAYVIDKVDGLRTMTDRNGNSLAFTRDGVTSSEGPAITFTRDASDRITRIDSPVGATTYGYDQGRLVSSTDVAGSETTYVYEQGLLTEVRGTGGRSLGSAEYDADGRMVAWIDAGGNRTTFDADVDALQERVTDPAGRLTTVSSYDDAGDLVRSDQVFDGVTHTTRWTYDAQHRVLSETTPGGAVTRLTWTAGGEVRTITDPAGRTITHDYDAKGRLSKVTGPDGTVTKELTYDEAGNVTSQKRADGTSDAFTLDAEGRVSSVTRAGAVVQRFTYDSLGRVGTVVDADGTVKTYGYDAKGRVTSFDDGTNPPSTFGYDDYGRLVSTKDAAGGTRTWVWDDRGQLRREVDLAGRTTEYTYDDAGRLVERVNRNGDATTFAYDANGRLVRQASRTNVVEFTYDGLGRITEASDLDSTVELAYDRDGNVVRQVQDEAAGSGVPSATLSFGYDASGERTSLTGLDGTRTFRLDPSGAISGVTDVDGGAFDLGYDPSGALNRITMPNGVVDALDWSETDGSLASRTTTLGGQVLAGGAFEHSTGRQRTAMVDAAGRHEYGYDAQGRLTSADHPTGSSVADESYSYDVMGNRTTGGAQHDSANRLLRDDRYTYTYDGEGNLLTRTDRASGRVRTYEWAVDGALLSVRDGAAVSRYRYDALGRRIEVEAPDGTVRGYVYDGSNVAHVLDGSGALLESFATTEVPGLFLSRTAGGATTYPVFDGLGSVVGYTDKDGQLRDQTEYSAFGESSGDRQTYGYTGHQYDADTGLVYARARYYDPASGRFLSEDPAPAFNPYPYADNQPCNRTDPTGAVSVEYAMKTRLGAQIARYLGEEAGTFVCATILNTVLTMTGLPSRNAKGAAAEDLIRRIQGADPGRLAPYTGATGTTRYPDFIENGRLGEIKNVLKQAFTKQISDLIDEADARGNGPAILVVRHNTQLSGKVLDMAKNGKLTILQCLPG